MSKRAHSVSLRGGIARHAMRSPQIVRPNRRVLSSSLAIPCRPGYRPIKLSCGAGQSAPGAFDDKAGAKPWARLFHNLRGSRETELAQDFPIHVVAQWLGNTPKVAAAHYLQVRDIDFERAIKA